MLRTLSFFACICACIMCGCNSAPTSEAPQTPEVLIARVEQSLQKLTSYSCQLEVSIDMTAQGVQQKIESAYDVTIAKPNRWAIIQKSGMMGGSSVSDGKQITTYSAMLSSYSVEDYSKDVLSTVGPQQGFMMLGAGALPQIFMGEGIERLVLSDTANSELLGTDRIGGVEYQLARYKRKDGTTIKIWVDTTDRYLVRRFVMVPDFARVADGMTDKLKDMKMSVTFEFTDWNTSLKPSAEVFVFKPPKDAEKVDSLFSGGAHEEGPHPLLGEQAPEFTTQTSTGDTIEFSDHRGEDVVILDFWATWCGPCTAALPIISDVAHEFVDKNVVFYAVNQGESADVIREYLEESGLELTVLMDEDGAMGDMYQVSGIPQTVLIDKQGRIQAVHVGFGSDLKDRLSRELEDILAGKDLAAESLEKYQERETAAKESIEPSGMSLAWSDKGPYMGVAADSTSSRVFALQRNGKLNVFSASGEPTDSITLPEAESSLRLANLIGGDEPEFLSFGPWGDALKAYSHSGELLWTSEGGNGIDDVACGDIHGDGTDDVVIGYNGGTGVMLLDNRGIELWTNNTIANVWNVTTGAFLTEREFQIITTSATGHVHVFDEAGEQVEEFNVDLYGHNIRYVPPNAGQGAGVVVTGTGDDTEGMVLIDSTGKQQWKIDVPTAGKKFVDSLAVDSQGLFAVVATRGGLVHVVNLAEGVIVASVGGQGTKPEAAILTRSDGTRLVVVATGSKLNAYAVERP